MNLFLDHPWWTLGAILFGLFISKVVRNALEERT